MGLSTSERVSLFVRCDNADCGQSVQKPLSWLIIRNSMACPSCGSEINLQSGDNGTSIQVLGNACAGLDAVLSKTG